MLFRVDASLHPASSASRALGDLVEGQWTDAHPSAPVARRDLAADPIRFESWAAAVSSGTTAPEDLSEAQRSSTALAARLADELIDADALLLTVPLYNYGVPQHVKSWFDLAYTDPRIGPGGSALQGKPAVLVTTLGGNYEQGTPKHGWDHATPWLRRALEDVWGLDLEVVNRSFTLVGVNPALDRFTDVAADLRHGAEQDARRAGRQLAGRARAAA